MPDFSDVSDVLNLSTVLRKASVNRTSFDPSKDSHLESFRTFLRTGNWGDVQFYCEAPFTDVPMTVLMKYAMFRENTQRESGAEQNIRLSKMNLVNKPVLVLTALNEAALHSA
jgi:hypothetical protein